MFEAFRKRIEDIQNAPARALPRAVARIEKMFRADATTKRGNVPTSIDVRESGDSVTVAAAPWVMKRAAKPDEWVQIVADEVREEVKR